MAQCICPFCEESGGHPRRCRELVTDDRWGPWCNDCNRRRFTRIDKGFAEISAGLGADTVRPADGGEQ